MSTLKRFVRYYKPYTRTFLLDLASAFVVALLELVFPTITKEFINDFIPNTNLARIVFWSIVLVIMYAIRAIFQYVMLYWGHMVGTRMEVDMRRDLFEHLHVLPHTFFDDNKTGQIMSRLVGDLREISELAHHGPEDLFISIVMIAGSFVALVLIEPLLTGIIFIVLAVLVAYTLKKRFTMLETFRAVRQAHGGINEKVENSISGIRVCIAFTNEHHEIEQFNAQNRRYQASYKSAYRHMAEYSSISNFLMGSLLLLVLVIGGVNVFQGVMNYGELVAFLLYTSFFVKPIERLVQFMQQYQAGIAGFERFIEIMDVKPCIVDKQGAMVLDRARGQITFSTVSFRYAGGCRDVITGLDLAIEPGKHVALVGTSGVGKTTIVHLLPRFYDVTAGSILVDGVDVRDIQLKSLRRNIGIVQQDTFLFTGTIKENILYGNLDASDEQVISAAKQAQIHDFIISLPEGYDAFIGERGVKLSGGQKQRVAIARVILKDPPILILDEATSSLDSVTETAIQEALEQLSVGRTTITVAHRLSTITRADEILFLTDDGIAERGTHRQLLQQGKLYARLHAAQQQQRT